MKFTGILAYILLAPAVLFLGRFELHTDDTGVEVFFLLLITFVLGCLHPRHAWQWALLVGPVIPLVEVLFGHPAFGRDPLRGVLLLLTVVIALGLVGSYAGAGVRRVVR